MHELSIAQSVVKIIEEEMQKHDAGTLKAVRLNIGRMSTIVPDSLSFSFEIITKDTSLEGAKLVIDIIPIKVFCHGCGKESEIEDYAFSCPGCGGTGIEVVSGQELSIVEIEVE